VVVYGSKLKKCCPIKREETKTDQNGEFRVNNPGAVIHVWKEHFGPRSLVVRSETSELRITMEPATDDLRVPQCRKPARDARYIGWGPRGLQFPVPRRAVKVSGGEPDVDYVRYIIQPTAGASHMELWFGPYAMNFDPEDGLVVGSSDFAQRNVVNAGNEFLGMDSWGHLSSGTGWRHTSIIGEGGATYEDANAEETELYDQTINSLCTRPLPPSKH
jgi:hypothetical protein